MLDKASPSVNTVQLPGISWLLGQLLAVERYHLFCFKRFRFYIIFLYLSHHFQYM